MKNILTSTYFYVALVLTTAAILIGYAFIGERETATDADPSGSWSNEEYSMIAVVEGDTITIDMVEDDFTGLYWRGTFPDNNSSTILSVADQEALDASLLGSTSDTKEFDFDGETLSFELSFMGTTQTVEMTR